MYFFLDKFQRQLRLLCKYLKVARWAYPTGVSDQVTLQERLAVQLFRDLSLDNVAAVEPLTDQCQCDSVCFPEATPLVAPRRPLFRPVSTRSGGSHGGPPSSPNSPNFTVGRELGQANFPCAFVFGRRGRF